MIPKKPEGFESCLSDFGEVIFDSYSGKPIGWGFKIIQRMSKERFEELGRFGYLECAYPDWFLITKKLTKEEAEQKYGAITHIERGPRGGYKWAQFGETRFFTKLEGI